MSRRWLLILGSLCALLQEVSPSILYAQGPYPPQLLPNGLFYGPGGYFPGSFGFGNYFPGNYGPVPYGPGMGPAIQFYGAGPAYGQQPGYNQPAYNPNGFAAPNGPPGFSPNPNPGVNPVPQAPGVQVQGGIQVPLIPGQGVPGPGLGYGSYYPGTVPFSAYRYNQQRPALPFPGYTQPSPNGNPAYPNPGTAPNAGSYPNAGTYPNPGYQNPGQLPGQFQGQYQGQYPGQYPGQNLGQGNTSGQSRSPYPAPQAQPFENAIDPRSPFWQRQMQSQTQPRGTSQPVPLQQLQTPGQPPLSDSPFLRKHTPSAPGDYIDTRPRQRENGTNTMPRGTGPFVPFLGAPITNIGPELPLISRPHELLPRQPSTLEQQARSVHFQGQGDIWFRQQNYMQAYSRYKQAAGAAPDLAAPRFRMAYAMIALKRYEVAVEEMARGILLDPRYPLIGDSPAKVFGPDNQIAAGALVGQVADWVKQEIRSPDRLFLLGALLRLNGEVENARICFEAASQLGGQPPPVLAFLKLDPAAGTLARTARPRLPQDNEAPVPESVEELLRNKAISAPAGPAQPGAGNAPANQPQFGSQLPGQLPPGQRLPGPNQIGPIPLGIQPPGKPGTPTAPGQGAPASDPDSNDAESPPANPPAKEDAEPASGTAPAENEKPTTPGFEAIPKKGPANPPTNPPATGKPPEVNGPVIPIPQSGN